MGSSIRLDKYICQAGYGSRKDVRSIISKGLITVNGNVITDSGYHVSPDDVIVLDGRTIGNQSYYYYMLNKPAGVISATEDASEKTVLDLFPKDHPKGLAPVGRLDKDTVGLLLITNDGEMAHRLISPRSDITKTYYAKTAEVISFEDVTAFSAGITLKDGTLLLPAELSVDKDDPRAATVSIREGKYHQIKRMFAARGNKVLYLKRLSMGSLSLDPTLPEGSYRELSEDELSALRSTIHITNPV